MSEPIYSIQNVSRKYGELAALDDVSIDIERGEWLSVVGPSGSGKSTLMNILGCMDSPTHGTVLMEGQRLDRLGERELALVRRQRIGLVFQQFHLVRPGAWKYARAGTLASRRAPGDGGPRADRDERRARHLPHERVSNGGFVSPGSDNRRR